MSVDDSKLSYYSGWDIDQLEDSQPVAVASGDHTVLTLSGTPTVPDVGAQFQPTGSSKWYNEGTSSTNNTQAGLFTFYTYISGTAFHAVTSGAGVVRYFLWKDRIDY